MSPEKRKLRARKVALTARLRKHYETYGKKARKIRKEIEKTTELESLGSGAIECKILRAAR